MQDLLEELNRNLTLITTQTQANYEVLLVILGLMVGVYTLNLILGNRLLYFGIIPRRWYGLPGIIFSPFLHANFNHLFFNLIPLIVLSNFILIRGGLNYFIEVSLVIGLISGFLVWLLAKPGIHIGASALITGYWGLLVSDIYQQGTLIALILGLLSAYYFAGIFLGIFPGKKGISWEGHLFGLVGGVAASMLLI